MFYLTGSYHFYHDTFAVVVGGGGGGGGLYVYHSLHDVITSDLLFCLINTVDLFVTLICKCSRGNNKK